MIIDPRMMDLLQLDPPKSPSAGTNGTACSWSVASTTRAEEAHSSSASSSASSVHHLGPCPSPDVDILSCTPAPNPNPAPPFRLSASPLSGSGGSGSGTGSVSGGYTDQEKKYYCQRCLNHKEEHPRKGHKPFCRYRDCQCAECQMVEQRRLLNNALNPRKMMSASGADGRKSGSGAILGFGSGAGPKQRDPKCARCSAHGENSALRGHKKALCPFLGCQCEKCDLVERRRRLMADQIKLRRQQKKARERQSGDGDEESGDGTDAGMGPPPPPAPKRIAAPKKRAPLAVSMQSMMARKARCMPPPPPARPAPPHPPFMLAPPTPASGMAPPPFAAVHAQLALLQQQHYRSLQAYASPPPGFLAPPHFAAHAPDAQQTVSLPGTPPTASAFMATPPTIGMSPLMLPPQAAPTSALMLPPPPQATPTPSSVLHALLQAAAGAPVAPQLPQHALHALLQQQHALLQLDGGADKEQQLQGPARPLPLHPADLERLKQREQELGAQLSASAAAPPPPASDSAGLLHSINSILQKLQHATAACGTPP